MRIKYVTIESGNKAEGCDIEIACADAETLAKAILEHKPIPGDTMSCYHGPSGQTILIRFK